MRVRREKLDRMRDRGRRSLPRHLPADDDGGRPARGVPRPGSRPAHRRPRRRHRPGHALAHRRQALLRDRARRHRRAAGDALARPASARSRWPPGRATSTSATTSASRARSSRRSGGELSVLADRWAMVAKALRPLPDKHKGLTDPEARVRLRYVDLAVNADSRQMIRNRATVLRSVRATLDRHDFLEVETPLLQPIHGGAAARPFATHLNAFDQPMYLRIAIELYLKRLVVGGLDRVYEIGRNFRNEGVDATHSPEFTMLEVYEAYGDYNTMADADPRDRARCRSRAGQHRGAGRARRRDRPRGRVAAPADPRGGLGGRRRADRRRHGGRDPAQARRPARRRAAAVVGRRRDRRRALRAARRGHACSSRRSSPTIRPR